MPISRDQLNDLVAANGNVVNTDGQKIGGIGTSISTIGLASRNGSQ